MRGKIGEGGKWFLTLFLYFCFSSSFYVKKCTAPPFAVTLLVLGVCVRVQTNCVQCGSYQQKKK